jgi:Fe-S cluster assembly iron-binding protein IscA
LVQGEPTEEDIVIQIDDMSFAVEDYYQEVFKSFDIDYSSGLFRKGFVVYPNGQRISHC